MMDLPGLMLLLLFGHALADGPLQAGGLSGAKRPGPDQPRGRWFLALCAHGVVHGGFVALATGSAALGWAEAGAHVAIDFAKGRGRITELQDQLLHLACKVVWALAAVTLARGAG